MKKKSRNEFRDCTSYGLKNTILDFRYTKTATIFMDLWRLESVANQSLLFVLFDFFIFAN